MCIESDKRERLNNSEQITSVKAELSTLKRKMRLASARRVLQRDKEQKAAARRKVAAKKKAAKVQLARTEERNQLRFLQRQLTSLNTRQRELKARGDGFGRY